MTTGSLVGLARPYDRVEHGRVEHVGGYAGRLRLVEHAPLSDSQREAIRGATDLLPDKAHKALAKAGWSVHAHPGPGLPPGAFTPRELAGLRRQGTDPSEVIGKSDPETRTVHVAAGKSGLGARNTLLHELLHSVDDQSASVFRGRPSDSQDWRALAHRIGREQPGIADHFHPGTNPAGAHKEQFAELGRQILTGDPITLGGGKLHPHLEAEARKLMARHGIGGA